MDSPKASSQQCVNRDWLMGRVMTMFGHFYQPDTDAMVARMIAEDWWDALRELPQAAVDTACRNWIKSGPARRPTPSEIRDMAAKANDAALYAAHLALPAPRPQATPERVPCSEEARARILAENGLSERRLAAIAGGRRMPPPNQPGHVEPEPAPPLTAEEAAKRPYTDRELARMRALRPQADERQAEVMP